MTGMDKETIMYCLNCGLEIRHVVGCPQCGGQEFGSIERPLPTIFDPEKIRPYIETLLSKADGYIPSRIPCFFCDGSHYMVWPGKRNPADYTDIRRLSVLPHCPIRVWMGTKEKGLGMRLSDFIRSLAVDNG